MIRWRYESVIVNPSPIEIVATMIAFSPTRADAFWTLMTKDDPASAHTAHTSPARAKTRRVTRGVTPFDRGPRPERAGCLGGNRLARGRGPLRRLLGNREDPDHAALRHVLLPAEKIRDQPLLEGRVDAPAGHDADVLSAVDGGGGRRRDDAGGP